LNAWTNLSETWYTYHGIWAHLNGVFHISLPSVFVYVFPPSIVSSQWLGKNFTTATNTHAALEKLLDASFSMRSVSYRRNVGDYFFSQLLVCFLYLRFPFMLFLYLFWVEIKTISVISIIMLLKIGWFMNTELEGIRKKAAVA
jgi:hypothetical protein